MVLHDARIRDSVIGCRGADTAARFLHYYRKDEAVVDKCGSGDELDGFVHVYDFLVGVEVDVKLVARPFHVPSAVVEPGRFSIKRQLVMERFHGTHISMNDIHLSFAGQP